MAECFYEKFICLKRFNDFLIIYLGEGRGARYMYMYVNTQVRLSYRTDGWMFS